MQESLVFIDALAAKIGQKMDEISKITLNPLQLLTSVGPLQLLTSVGFVLQALPQQATAVTIAETDYVHEYCNLVQC